MLRVHLLTATATVALFAGSSALAQEVMTPPAPTPETAPATAMPPAPAATNTVMDVLMANGQFSTLVAALDAARLTETLRSQGAISIFAPTDAAFAALPEAARTRLMDPANVNELRQLLLYHVVVADVNSSQITGAKGGVETAARMKVQLDGTGDAIKVDGATVTTADIDASNGAIFAIDQVLSPTASQALAGDAGEAAPADIPTPPPATAPADETDDAAPPAGEAEETMNPPTAAPPAATTLTRRAGPGTNAPNGQPAVATTTTAAPPVANPTDGQVDDEDMDDAGTPPAPKPRA